MSQVMKLLLLYLSHRRPAKAQASLRIRAVCQSIRCSHTWSMEVDKGSDQKTHI